MENLGLIVVSALRYALPRHTYITSTVADFIWNNRENPEIKNSITLIKGELKHWIADNAPTDSMSKIDYDNWVALLNKLETL